MIKFVVFVTDDLHPAIPEKLDKVSKKIGVEIDYHVFDTDGKTLDDVHVAHGKVLTERLAHAGRNDVVCFLDVDCLPYSLKELEDCYEWVVENKSFIGNAQNISHTSKRNRVYAAPSMMMVHKQAWLNLESPDLACNKNRGDDDSLIDTAQLLTNRAIETGFEYKILLPIGYDDSKLVYKLGPYGFYGRGTKYPGTWHFFRMSSFKNGTHPLWEARAGEILSGKKIRPVFNSIGLDTHRMIPLNHRFSLRSSIFRRLKHFVVKYL
jgi:hypothetical protein